MINAYLLGVLFILISHFSPFREFIVRGFNIKSKTNATIVYLLVLIGIFTLFSFSLNENQKDIKEDFFFTVSECNPKCSGAYYGKPATFQFDEIKSEGVSCQDDNCPSYGMIRGCSTAKVYGKGYYPEITPCREGVC